MNSKTQFFEATIISITKATKRILVFRLKISEEDFHFRPGQWIDLYAPIEGQNVGGYTITSSIFEKNYIELAVRESTTHPVTHYLHHEAILGSVVLITEGQGKFFLTEELQLKSLTFLAGGIGLTPLLSMFRSMNKNKLKIFYSVSNEEDILFKEELLGNTIFTITKNHSESWAGETTRINMSMLKKYHTDFSSDFFLCGPRPMIDDLINELTVEGVDKKRIHYEKWW